MEKNDKMNWDATAFFAELTRRNKLAQEEGVKFCRVSGLSGFEECLAHLQSSRSLIAVSDTSQGALITSDTTPHIDKVKLVFLAKRHREGDMLAREAAMNTLREIFRQFMSQLIREKVRLAQGCIYLDDSISFNEIDSYFFGGMACAYFQIKVTTFTNLCYNPDEWIEP